VRKALEYEDKFWMDGSHGYGIGPAVVPAAFATAEHLGGVDGKAFLTAVALATDVTGAAAHRRAEVFRLGWNPTYVLAVFGAAMAAAKLLDLDPEQFANAIGIAIRATSRVTANERQKAPTAIRLQMGFAVRNGITAAQLQGSASPAPITFSPVRSAFYRLIYHR
jgi:2-methylcitrate dehydratase PrpD